MSSHGELIDQTPGNLRAIGDHCMVMLRALDPEYGPLSRVIVRFLVENPVAAHEQLLSACQQTGVRLAGTCDDFEWLDD